MKRPVRRGHLLVLEGLDGAGTTTQARLLCDALGAAGRQVHLTAEPSSGPVGALLRQVLSKRLGGAEGQGFDPAALALLFAADRLDHLAAEVVPRLAAGVDVVCDRYTLSSLAYQAVTCGDLAWVEALNARARAPDVTIFLEVPPRTALARRLAATSTREIFEVPAFQQKVAAAYGRALDRLRERGERVVVLPGEQPIDEVAAAVLATAREVMGEAPASGRPRAAGGAVRGPPRGREPRDRRPARRGRLA